MFELQIAANWNSASLDVFKIFQVGGAGGGTKTLYNWPHGKQWVLCPLNLNVPLGFALGNAEGQEKQN